MYLIICGFFLSPYLGCMVRLVLGCMNERCELNSISIELKQRKVHLFDVARGIESLGCRGAVWLWGRR